MDTPHNPTDNTKRPKPQRSRDYLRSLFRDHTQTTSVRSAEQESIPDRKDISAHHLPKLENPDTSSNTNIDIVTMRAKWERIGEYGPQDDDEKLLTALQTSKEEIKTLSKEKEQPTNWEHTIRRLALDIPMTMPLGQIKKYLQRWKDICITSSSSLNEYEKKMLNLHNLRQKAFNQGKQRKESADKRQ
jgi:Mg2+ and Co2+ transporter CorA